MLPEEDVKLLKDFDWWKNDVTIMPRFYHLAVVARSCLALEAKIEQLQEQIAKLSAQVHGLAADEPVAKPSRSHRTLDKV